jgi:hypothetical protein
MRSGVEDRRQAEEDAAAQRPGRGENEDTVDVDLAGERRAGRRSAIIDADAPHGEEEAEQRADDGPSSRSGTA